MKKYKLTVDENVVQNTETTAFVPITNKEYQNWLKDKNTPSPQFTTAEKKEQEKLKIAKVNEQKIQAKMQQMAIEALKADNELPVSFLKN